MKKAYTLLGGVAFVLGMVGTAWAIPVTYSDLVLMFPPAYVSEGESTTWQHDINDDGFNPSADTLSSVRLTLLLSDDLDVSMACWWSHELEYGSLTVGSETYDLGEIDFGLYRVSLSAFVQLQDQGLLDVTLSSTGGDFYFWGSQLTARAEQVAPVPEPQTMLLLGCGLIGLAGLGRKRLFGSGGETKNTRRFVRHSLLRGIRPNLKQRKNQALA
ncbi:MAG: PEP-CTERM sorting domain-containing protein [Deltaproteobacteria bacterium]|nr:PEP-CTERM sorting domain-containing protein [Deltaproteobacteria bacterium]